MLENIRLISKIDVEERREALVKIFRQNNIEYKIQN